MSPLDENHDYWQTPEDIGGLIEIIKKDWTELPGKPEWYRPSILDTLIKKLQKENEIPGGSRRYLLYLIEQNCLTELFEQKTLEKLAEVLDINRQELGLT